MTPEQIFGAINERQTAAVVAAVTETPSLATARDPALGSTPLHFAAHRGLEEIVGALLAAGADVRAREAASGTTALHWAAEGGHAGIVRALVAGGAEVDARDSWFDLTPLGWATVVLWNPAFHADRGAAAEALVEAGARQDAFTKVMRGAGELEAGEVGARLGPVGRGQTPLHVAVTRKQREAVRRLAALGADLGARTTFGMSALALAVAGGDESMAALLRHLGAEDDASVAVVSGAAPAQGVGADEPLLFAAAQIGNAPAVRALLAAGTSPDARMRHLLGETPATVTPVQLSAEAGHAAAVQALADAGADVNAGREDGLPTPLHLAAGGGYVETVRVLLAAGADRTARDGGYGATPQGWAEFAGHTEVVALLGE